MTNMMSVSVLVYTIVCFTIETSLDVLDDILEHFDSIIMLFDLLLEVRDYGTLFEVELREVRDFALFAKQIYNKESKRLETLVDSVFERFLTFERLEHTLVLWLELETAHPCKKCAAILGV